MEHSRKRTTAIVIQTAVIVLAAAIVMQLIPYGRSHVNPPVQAEPPWDSPRTRELFFRACADCHSNETAWPWYSRIAPVSWLIEWDVRNGRKEFNVSEWGRPEENEGHEAAKTIRSGEMPPWFYTIPHPEARLLAGERTELINGMRATFGEEKGETHGDDD